MTESVVLDILLLSAFLAILVKSATFAVESITKFSRIVGISELAAGFFIVALSTSMPEITVAIFSVESDNVGITLGDIFGSNITNIGLIAALFMLLSPIKQIEKKTVQSLSPLLVIAAAIPFFLLIVEEGSKLIGIILLAIFGIFIYRTLKSNLQQHAFMKGEPQLTAGSSAIKQFVLFAIGISLVIASAKMVVDSASSIADHTGIRESVLGATIISLGTSLPELSVDLAAVRRRHFNLALGDIIGSSLTNIGLILGIVLLLSHIPVHFGVLSTLIVFAIVTHSAMFMILRRAKVRAWHSAVLLSIYGIFLLTIYGIQLTIGSHY
ncbi:MAG TPA: sodium:calcium antiporter [Nitrososphaera sp.]